MVRKAGEELYVSNSQVYVLGPAGICSSSITVCYAVFVSARIDSFRLVWFVRFCDLRIRCIMQPSGSITLRARTGTRCTADLIPLTVQMVGTASVIVCFSTWYISG
jgi:hypothetical protein